MVAAKADNSFRQGSKDDSSGPTAHTSEGKHSGWAGRAGEAVTWAGGMGWYFVVGWWLVGLLFLLAYLLLLTFVGRRLSKRVFALALARALTLGQDPPGAAKLAATAHEAQDAAERGTARRVLESAGARWYRSRAARFYTRLAHSDPPPSPSTRALWFVLVGWWFGASWTFVAWLAVLPPYPFVGFSRALIARVPALVTLERPRPEEQAPPSRRSTERNREA
jgi:hypothetical protein